METNTKKKKEQTDHLKQLFNEVQQNNEQPKNNALKLHHDHETTKSRDIDILNLPPRKDVHGQNNQWVRLKFGKPFRRLLAVIVVIIVIAIGIYILWEEGLLTFVNG